jgi:LysM repeat protein
MKISLGTGINMTPQSRLVPIIAFIASTALPVWGQQYLYVPQPVTATQASAPQEGILVQEVEIKKGDTLSDLSRKFSGRGMYFPQILLFNSIKNPNLIYTGSTLKIPVTKRNGATTGATAPSTETRTPQETKISPAEGKEVSTLQKPADSIAATTSESELSSRDVKLSGVKNSRKKVVRLKTLTRKPLSAPLPASARVLSAPTTAPAAPSAGQNIFETAVTAYRKGDCSTAVEQFDRFLADNAHSPLAADATLYRADCYLKLSAQ